jgi:hypothetical protein
MNLFARGFGGYFVNEMENAWTHHCKPFCSSKVSVSWSWSSTTLSLLWFTLPRLCFVQAAEGIHLLLGLCRPGEHWIHFCTRRETLVLIRQGPPVGPFERPLSLWVLNGDPGFLPFFYQHQGTLFFFKHSD